LIRSSNALLARVGAGGLIDLSQRALWSMILVVLLALTGPTMPREVTSTYGPKASELVAAKSIDITHQEMRFRFYRNPQSDSLILFLHGGPHDESWFLHALVFQRLDVKLWVEGFEDESSGWYGFLEYFVGNGFNVLMPYSYYFSDEREPWVYNVVTSVMHEFRLRHVYIVGFSSGGVVAANAIMGSTAFEKAVIIDAALCGYYGKREDIFSSAYASSNVEVPHLLVWGRNDSMTPVIHAQIWMKNADPKLARLRILEYGHDFRGTVAENEVKLEVLRFLRPNGFLRSFVYFMEIVIAAAVVVVVLQGRAQLKKRRI